MLENSFTDPAQAQTGVSLVRQDSFETSQVEVSGNTIFVRRYGNGPAILMVHGFPRTSLMWRFLAPKLADNHTVICVDLRRSACLRPQWDTRFRRRSLPLFQARNGKGTS
jgi:pimeloyl-ACP methyl ester carboxylesterase